MFRPAVWSAKSRAQQKGHENGERSGLLLFAGGVGRYGSDVQDTQLDTGLAAGLRADFNWTPNFGLVGSWYYSTDDKDRDAAVTGLGTIGINDELRIHDIGVGVQVQQWADTINDWRAGVQASVGPAFLMAERELTVGNRSESFSESGPGFYADVAALFTAPSGFTLGATAKFSWAQVDLDDSFRGVPVKLEDANVGGIHYGLVVGWRF